MSPLCWGRGGISVPEELFPLEEKRDRSLERREEVIATHLLFFLVTDTVSGITFGEICVALLSSPLCTEDKWLRYLITTWAASLSISILPAEATWWVPIVPYTTDFSAGLINLLQHPLSITLLCDGKTSVYLSVWSWTLCSNLFNSPICFPASETITTRTWIFFSNVIQLYCLSWC